jgi:predicted ester cyclase
LITEQIWSERRIELCLDYYSPDCVIHTTGGDVIGAEAVVDNTRATLAAFPDRRLDADNVIWSDEGAGTFYSSHLITSKMTNLGPSEFGPATGRKVRVLTIADCLCRENRIVREWLVRDNFGLVRQLGFDESDVARAQAQRDRAAGFSLLDFHAHTDEPAPPQSKPANEAEHTALEAFRAVWAARQRAEGIGFYDFRVDALFPGALNLYGPDEIASELEGVFRAFPDGDLRVEHLCSIPYLGDSYDVALRWRLQARHAGAGRYGEATGALITIIGVSHFRIMRGRIRQERTIWDDLAVRRQIETARLDRLS